jgi:hypothetical protein
MHSSAFYRARHYAPHVVRMTAKGIDASSFHPDQSSHPPICLLQYGKRQISGRYSIQRSHPIIRFPTKPISRTEQELPLRENPLHALLNPSVARIARNSSSTPQPIVSIHLQLESITNRLKIMIPKLKFHTSPIQAIADSKPSTRFLQNHDKRNRSDSTKISLHFTRRGTHCSLNQT